MNRGPLTLARRRYSLRIFTPLCNARAESSKTAACVLVAILAVTQTGSAQTEGIEPHTLADIRPDQQVIHELGAYQSTISDLRNPTDVAFDSQGRIYIADEQSHQIRIYGSDSQRVAAWGRRGTAPGELNRPGGLAISRDGEIFVADSGNHRVQVFDADGAFIRSWGGYGRGKGQFNNPTRVAVNDGRVYVVDEGNHRVEVFDREAIHQFTIGRYGKSDGEFRRPTGVAVDPLGNVYVADGDNARVQRFDASGKFIKAWSQWGPYPGFIMNPSGIQVQSGRVYVADGDNHRVHVFDVDGGYLYRFGVHAVRPREGNGRLHYPNAVAIAPNGVRAVVCEGFENRCQLFGIVTPETPKDPLANSGLDLTLVSHYGQRCDVDGRLMAITEPESHSVLVYDLSAKEPIWITQIGTYGGRNGEFVRPTDVKLDTSRSLLYVCDAGNRRIQTFRLSPPPADAIRFDPLMAKFASSIDLCQRARAGADSREHVDVADIEPTAIERDENGNTYILDATHRRLLKFDAEWNLSGFWGQFGRVGGGWGRPTDLVYHRATKTLRVVDADRRCIFLYHVDGSAAGTLRPRSDLGVVEPFGMCVDDDGSVYVTDMGADRILKYDNEGQFLRHWGSPGLGAGELYRPTSIQLDHNGRLIVIDFGNHRGAYFSTDGEFIDVFGSRFFTAPARQQRKTN